MTRVQGARRNLRLYPWYVVGSSFFAWMPIFFLYFTAQLSLGEVLLLEAVYYAGVVLLEVPSGYFSDRFGRRLTLVCSAMALVLAYLVFGVTSSFQGLASGQILLATGLALNSGTDTSFHLGTLEFLGRFGFALLLVVLSVCSGQVREALSIAMLVSVCETAGLMLWRLVPSVIRES